ncbi:MAG: NADH-quinone oxidoreductase subunit B [Desulfopila sp.]
MGAQNIPTITEPVPSSIVHFAAADKLINICRANSFWPLTFGIACCAIEMMATGCARFDMSRFGAEVFRPSPRQSDVMIVAGTITKKMMPGIKTLYDQMPEPKWVMALGNCAISGGPFAFKDQYSIVLGADQFLPVDVYVPGCPPRPEALLQGIIELEHKVSGWQRWEDPEKKNIS